MASSERKTLEAALKPTLRQLGFRKRGGTWHRRLQDVIQVVNLQGSQWSKSFYLNLGVYFRALGAEENPAEYSCHVRTRLDALVPDEQHLTGLLDLESREHTSEDGVELAELVATHGIPWLEKCSKREGVATANQRTLVAQSLKMHFGLDES